MKKNTLLIGAAVIMLFGTAAAWLHQHDATKHHHDHGEVASAQPAPAVRWPSEPQLRTSMTLIRNGVAAVMQGEQNAEILPQLVDTQIDMIVRNCRLAPDADAALHPILARLAQGAHASSNATTRAAGFTTLRAALADYPNYFEHPQWQALPEQQ